VSEILPAKCRVEIHRGPPYLFDDHFCKNWTVLSGSKSLDGDTVVLTCDASSVAQISRSVAFNTVIYPWVIVRAIDSYCQNRYLRGFLGGIQKFEFTLSFGLNELNVSSQYHGNIDEIRLVVVGPSGNWARFDYVSICKNQVLTPIAEGDVVEELTVTRPLLSQGISGAKLTLHNFGGVFNGAINKHDVIIIWQARYSGSLGASDYKTFGGRIVNPTNRADGYGKHFIDLDCHGHAWELINPPALLQKLYMATNGRTIIEETLALANYVTRHPDNSKWFDAGGATGSTDDRINSTHDCEYDEVKPKTIIDEIGDKASNPAGVKGFDIVEMPSGVLIGHLRNSLDFISPIASITPETYSMSSDIHRIKNKIKVYGKAGKIGVPGEEGRKEPSDGDAWTVDSLDNWVEDAGELSIQTVGSKVGPNFLNCLSTSAPNEAKFRRSLTGLVTAFGKSAYQTLNFYLKAGAAVPVLKVRLYAPDSNNYFEADLGTGNVNWYFKQFQLGQNQEYDAEKNPNGKWTKVGSPKWGNLTWITFYGWDNASQFSMSIDGLYFGHGRFRGVAEDSMSQANYGIRAAEPEIDESLGNDTECTARAIALKDFLKDPVVTLERVLVDGDSRYAPADRQRVIIANDNYDAYSRIIQVQQKVVGVTWDTILTLSNEPQYVDYVFRDISIILSRLRRGG